MARGPRRASASTHRAAPGWGTSRSRCRRDTEGGCKGSRKTHSLHGGWEKNRNHTSKQGRKVLMAFTSYINGRYFCNQQRHVQSPLLRAQLSLALSRFPITCFWTSIPASHVCTMKLSRAPGLLAHFPGEGLMPGFSHKMASVRPPKS